MTRDPWELLAQSAGMHSQASSVTAGERGFATTPPNAATGSRRKPRGKRGVKPRSTASAGQADHGTPSATLRQPITRSLTSWGGDSFFIRDPAKEATDPARLMR